MQVGSLLSRARALLEGRSQETSARELPSLSPAVDRERSGGRTSLAVALTLDVQVALIADTQQPFHTGPIDEAFWRQPYASRRKVQLEVEPSETVASVLEQAAARLGLTSAASAETPAAFSATHRKIAFYVPEDEDGFADRPRARLQLYELTLVDDHGRAIFGVHNLRTVPYESLLKAAEAGTLDGDPRRPYLILDEGYGDAPPPDWAVVQQGIEVAWEVVKTIAIVSGATAGIAAARKQLRHRLGKARDALAANRGWAQRGYRPDQSAALVANRDWSAEALASLLGCRADEAEAVLWTLGHAFNESTGRWERRGDEAAEMMANIVEAIGWASHAYYEGWEPAIRRWIIEYMETGSPPPLENLEPDLEDDELHMYRPSLGERIDRLIDHFRRRP